MSRAEKVAKEIEGMMTLLRQKMSERGFSQVRVQAALGWKGSYISQLFTKAKAVRLEQILLILDVIDVPPEDFFTEYFRLRQAQRDTFDLSEHPELAVDEALLNRGSDHPSHVKPRGFLERFFRGFMQARTVIRAVVYLLIKKKVFTVKELEDALGEVKKGPAIHPPTWSDES